MLLGHGENPPSAWVRRFAGLVRPGGRVLDLACGSGRHVRWLAERGWALTGVDRDAAALAALAAACPRAELIAADVESGPWPLAERRFDGIVVTNYLWRPLWPRLLAALAEDGVLIYETFADGHQHIGRPSRPDFLLGRAELLQFCAALRVVAFEDGFEPEPARCVQRICAVNRATDRVEAPRYSLAGPGS
jgi:SAM-dependent methyltransferase